MRGREVELHYPYPCFGSCRRYVGHGIEAQAPRKRQAGLVAFDRRHPHGEVTLRVQVRCGA